MFISVLAFASRGTYRYIQFRKLKYFEEPHFEDEFTCNVWNHSDSVLLLYEINSYSASHDN